MIDIKPSRTWDHATTQRSGRLMAAHMKAHSCKFKKKKTKFLEKQQSKTLDLTYPDLLMDPRVQACQKAPQSQLHHYWQTCPAVYTAPACLACLPLGLLNLVLPWSFA